MQKKVEVKKTTEEKQIDLEKLYCLEEYNYLNKRLKQLLEIKKIRVFNEQLRKTIQNELDLLRITALIYYYELLQIKIDEENKTWKSRNEISKICEKIKKLFSNYKNFSQYVLEFPIENWEKITYTERTSSLKRILSKYFDLDSEAERRHT